MPNIYVFWAGSGDPPSPWTKIATYNGRWVRCDSTAANALATGGASTHTHTVSSSSTSTTTRSINSGSGYSVIVNHTHTVSVSSIGTANNEPPYYTLALIRMDLATWQSSPTFPVDVVVASYAAIDTATYTDFEQFTAANGYYIKLGTPGSTGGSSTHVHTLSGSLASAGRSINSTTRGSASSARGGAHTHTFSGNSASATSLPKNITTRFYRVKNQAAVIPVNIVCFFDGDPTSIFTKITAWDGAILGAANTNPTVSGSDTHTHSNSSITSLKIFIPIYARQLR